MNLRLRDRLNLPQNWPLWLVVGTALSSVLALLLSLAVNQWIPQYPDYYMGTVVYPLLVFSSWTLFIVPVALLISLFVMAVWALRRRYGLLMFIAALAANALVCYFCVGVTFNTYSFSHKQDLWFSGRLYRLAVVTKPDFDIPDYRYIVYECDLVGMSCTPFYRSNTYYSNDPDYSLRADSLTNTLYLLVDTDIDFVTYIDTGHTTAPINLPSLDTIIAENAHQALQLMNLLRGHTSQLAWSPDGQSLAVGGLSYSARSIQIGVWVYNMSYLQDPPLLMPIPKHEHDYNSAESIAFSPDGKLLAVGSGDDTTRLLDVDNGTEQNILRGHTSTVDAVAFSPDGSVLATGSGDHQIRLWDMNSLSIHTVLQGNDDDTYSGMYSLGFSPDGQLLASAGDVLHVWNMATNSIIASIVPPGEYASVRSLAFSPDGKWFAYGGSGSVLKLWDVEHRPNTFHFKSQVIALRIYSLAFNPMARSWSQVVRITWYGYGMSRPGSSLPPWKVIQTSQQCRLQSRW